MGTDVVLSVTAGAAACCYIFHTELPREQWPVFFQDLFQERLHSPATVSLPPKFTHVLSRKEGDITGLDGADHWY